MQAASADKLAVVEALLKAGADVNLRDKQGDTALTVAARDASAPVVKALLGAGANADLRNNNRATAADIAENLRRDAIRKLISGG
jgi:ankyrin repeat protein